MPSCPLCEETLSDEAKYCHACGLYFELMCQKYGFSGVNLPVVWDHGNLLKSKELATLRKRARAFESKYPQISVSIVLGSLRNDALLSEFVFWLLNTANIEREGRQNLLDNDKALVIVLDASISSVCVGAGYFVENLLNLHEVRASIRKRCKILKRKKYAKFFVNLLDAIDKLLQKSHGKLKTQGKQWFDDEDLRLADDYEGALAGVNFNEPVHSRTYQDDLRTEAFDHGSIEEYLAANEKRSRKTSKEKV